MLNFVEIGSLLLLPGPLQTSFGSEILLLSLQVRSFKKEHTHFLPFHPQHELVTLLLLLRGWVVKLQN